MKLNEIKDNQGARKDRKRVARGMGCGSGKTAGHGQKGQKSRSGVAINGFEGGQMPIYRRLPKRGFKNADRIVYALINLDVLEANFQAGDVVDLASLNEKKLLRKGDTIIKVLANGEITKALTVKAQKFSEAAVAKIQAAGGTVEIVD